MFRGTRTPASLQKKSPDNTDSTHF